MAGAATVGASWLTARSSLANASFQVDQNHENILVVIFLRGGADGLSVVAPYGDDNYRTARPGLGFDKKELIDLDGFFGLNPALSGLRETWDAGEMAVVHASGSGDKTLSHFEAISAMQRGLDNQTDSADGGWLGRHLLATPDRQAPLRAVALSSFMPESLGGAVGPIAIRSIDDYKLNSDKPGQLEKLERLYSSGQDVLSRAGRDTLSVLKRLDETDVKSYQPENGATYDLEKHMGRALREAAFLIKADMGLEVACLEMDGWDTHVAQGKTTGLLPPLLKELGAAIEAFRKDLGSLNKRVTIVVQTEFGRRLRENQALGTDHGRAGMMMLMGGGVKGGQVYGEWPGLVHSDGKLMENLEVSTDYRAILLEVLEKRLMTPDPASIFPSLKQGPLGLIARV
jgi:uncharacterized protein (DUF1501 family)